MASVAYRQLMDRTRLLGRRPPVVALAVHDGSVDCPRDGIVDGLERCMFCDRLVMLDADAHGEGTVSCRPGVTIDAPSGAVP